MATRLVSDIQAGFEVLLHSPLIGPRREMFAAGLRVTFRGNYAIYYLPTGTELVIVRILHGARDLRAIAERGGFGDQ
jgi:toxin ParE1/3/4